MNKQEFIDYIAVDNKGFFKTRRSHIAKHHPEILAEIENHEKVNKHK